MVYKTKSDDLAKLTRRRTLAIRSITPQMLTNVRRHFYLRLGCCQDAGGIIKQTHAVRNVPLTKRHFLLSSPSQSFGSESPSSAPRWKVPDYSSDTGLAPSVDKHIPTSHSSPASGFVDLNTSPRLPKAQNPTITLLQKAREGQLPRGAAYLEQEQKQFRPRNERPPVAAPGDVLYQIKHEYASESDGERRRRMAELGPRKFEGIGPVTKDGMPLILRSEIKDQNQSKWYKRMYDTIHKQRPHNELVG
ncbi:hypothetical protein NQ318_013930 [Aromia moschata]|uniref:SoHo domain-containing protein n=1 Tax=Aromia moschata TaxID=1265417 RepID=A0AAV8Z919_9CUCU|nr:hypothetical protein NQ318_013930 [Aromia moschata]